MIGFLILLFIFVAGFLLCKCLFTDLQRKTSINIKNKMVSYVATYEYEKRIEIRFFDFVVIVLVCIVWKIWSLPFI